MRDVENTALVDDTDNTALIKDTGVGDDNGSTTLTDGIVVFDDTDNTALADDTDVADRHLYHCSSWWHW